MDAFPKCDKEGCKHKGKEMYGYTDGELFIWLCYACGKFDGSSTDADLTYDICSDPEIILQMIEKGELAPIN